MKLSVVDRIHPQVNKLCVTNTGVENNATGDSELNDSPVHTEDGVCA